MCVGNDDDVRAVATGDEGAWPAMAPGQRAGRPHHRLGRGRARNARRGGRPKGVGFLDAPVSGGQAGAENGKLTIMVGGDAATFARAEPVLAHYARAVTLMGGPGRRPADQDGQPDLHRRPGPGAVRRHQLRGTKAGLDAEQVLDVISKGAAQSWQMENRGKTMIADKFDFGFAVDWMRKDLGICLAEARRNGARCR